MTRREIHLHQQQVSLRQALNRLTETWQLCEQLNYKTRGRKLKAIAHKLAKELQQINNKLSKYTKF